MLLVMNVIRVITVPVHRGLAIPGFFPCFLLRHLAPGAPAQHEEGDDDERAAGQGGEREGLAREQPVGEGDEEDGQQRRHGAQHRARERDEHEEAAGEGGVHDDADGEIHGRHARGQLERLPAEHVQDRERDPEHEHGEQADAAAERVGEEDAPYRRRALGRAGKALVEYLIQPVEHAPDTDDEVAKQACAGGHGVVGVTAIPIRHHEHADNGYKNGDRLIEAQLLLEQGYAESVGEKGGAVVNGGEVAGARHAHGHIPCQAGDGEAGRNLGRRTQHVRHRAMLLDMTGHVELLFGDHMGGTAQQGYMATPESRPRHLSPLQTQEEKLGGPEDDPRPVRQV